MPCPPASSIPTSASCRRVGGEGAIELCTIVGGGTPKRSESAYWGGNVPWYSVKDAPSDGEIWVINTSERITDHGLANSAARIVPQRLHNHFRTRDCWETSDGRCCHGIQSVMLRTPAWQWKVVWPSAPSPADGRWPATAAHSRLGFDTITRATFDGLMVAKPKGDVVSAFEVVVTPLLDVLLASLQESSKLAEIREYLLPKLLSGQVRVEVARG